MSARAKPIRQSAYDDAMFTMKGGGHGHRPEEDRRRHRRSRRGRRRGRAAARAGGARGDRARGRRLAHAARFRARRTAQQFPRLAAIGAEGQQRDPDPSAECVGALFAAAADPSDDERGRRHLAALLGAELAAQSMGLQGRERNDTPLRRARIPKGSTVEDWPFGLDELEPYYDKVEYEVGISGQAGNINGTIDERGNIFEGRPRARLPDAAAARHRVHRADGGDGAQARLASVPRAGGDQFADLRRPAGLPLSRLLQPRRLPRQRQEFDRGQHDSEGRSRPAGSRS